MRLSPRFLAPVLLALVTTPAVAQTVPGAPVASRVVAGKYVVEPNHTQVVFTLNHMGFTYYTGQFVQPSGTLMLDPKNPAADKVDITFDVKKVTSTAEHLNEHIQAPEFFDSAKFPTGNFTSTKVTVQGNTATILGNLTLKGITKQVVLNATFVGAGPAPMGPPKLNVGFKATTTIKRSDFGISAYVPLVSDEVQLTINAAFVAE